jgi:hypothetical protein
MPAKKSNIDWVRVDELLQKQCSGQGIASLLGISDTTLYNRCKIDKGLSFLLYSEKKKGEGKELLREKQYDLAMKGNVPLLIWLGKQYLDQKDKSEVEQTNINPEEDKRLIAEVDRIKKIVNNEQAG